MKNKTNQEILKELNKVVYGHEEVKKTIISLYRRTQIRYIQKYCKLQDEENLIEPYKCLLIGESGTGKTYIVESLSRLVSFPILKLDASDLTITGASKGIKKQDLQKMIYDYAHNYSMAHKNDYPTIEGTVDRMIIFVDELDKISKHYDGSSGAAWNYNVQSNFLTLFENYEAYSGVSWIFSGAFSNMKKRNLKNGLGFCANISNQNKLNIQDEDIINYGFLPELVGRINNIVELDKLSVLDYYNILENVLLPKKLREWRIFGIIGTVLSQEDKYILCEEAKNSGQGVRYLKRQLNKLSIEREFNYEQSRY